MIDRLLVRGGAAAGHAQAARPGPRADARAGAAGAQVAVDLRCAARTCASPRFSAASRSCRRSKRCVRGTDIIVATPGRLLDHMEQRTVDLSGIEILTLDEADRMLDMGFLPPLRRILKVLPRERQTLLFSATHLAGSRAPVGRLHARPAARRRVRRPGRGVDRDAPRASGRRSAQGRSADARAERRRRARRRWCSARPSTGRTASAQYLERAGIKAAVIHGNKSQGARTRALGDFKAGRVTVLVATDIAARGLDIAQLPLVVNFDLPLVAEDYIHRVGRTGRAGLDRSRGVAGVAGGSRSAARHPAPAAVADRARRRSRHSRERVVARGVARGGPPSPGPPEPRLRWQQPQWQWTPRPPRARQPSACAVRPLERARLTKVYWHERCGCWDPRRK